MKRLLYILFLLFPLGLLAQPASSIDFGGGVGISSYIGDINQDKAFYNPQLSFDGFVRYNFNNRYALRANVMHAKLKANDQDFDNPYQQKRSRFFVRSILEVGIIGEVNFFPYQNPAEWGTSEGTIYALLGVGYAISYTLRREKASLPNVTFGVGYKRNLGSRWAVETEWAFRKLPNDGLDEISDPIKSGEKSRLFNNDFYNVLEVRLSYNLWQQSGKCRAFDRDTDL